MKFYLPILAIIFVFFGCSSCSNCFVLGDSNEKYGKWNATDSSIVTKIISKDILGSSWSYEFQIKKERKPVISVGVISNNTYEHIDTKVIARDLIKLLLNSDKTGLIFFKKKTNSLSNIHNKSEQKSDFLLKGKLHAIVDQIINKKAVLYQLDMELVSNTTNLVVWHGQAKIKKIINKQSISW